jgi:hypothetical protein
LDTTIPEVFIIFNKAFPILPQRTPIHQNSCNLLPKNVDTSYALPLGAIIRETTVISLSKTLKTPHDEAQTSKECVVETKI